MRSRRVSSQSRQMPTPPRALTGNYPRHVSSHTTAPQICIYREYHISTHETTRSKTGKYRKRLTDRHTGASPSQHDLRQERLTSTDTHISHPFGMPNNIRMSVMPSHEKFGRETGGSRDCNWYLFQHHEVSWHSWMRSIGYGNLDARRHTKLLSRR